MLYRNSLKICLWLELFCHCLTDGIYAEPPRQIPENLHTQFTLDGKIPVQQWFIDNTCSDNTPRFYSWTTIDAYIERIKNKQPNYYGNTDLWLYQAFEAYSIQGKTVAIIGSVEPWYESVVLAFGGKPLTIEYNRIITDDSRLTLMTADEYENNPIQCDIVLSISSTEHDGLGRYGDPINPSGDFEFMDKVKNQMLKPGGYLILAVPCGSDCLVWNAHRIYGSHRLPLLLQGWDIVDSFGIDSFEANSRLFCSSLGDTGFQPVFLLQPN